MQLFLAQQEGDLWSLANDEVRHLKVLRKQIGDTLLVTDGKGQLARVVLNGSLKKPTLEILHLERLEPNPVQLEIAVSPLKNHDRIDWMVEKCTEIGVNAFHFIACQQSERKNVRIDRLEKKAVAAMKQSGRVFLPSFSWQPLESFTSNLNQFENVYIAHCQVDDTKITPREIQLSKGKNLILIGPEGDFTLDEVAMIKAKGGQKLSLGSYRLRTETAVLALSAFLQLRDVEQTEYEITSE